MADGYTELHRGTGEWSRKIRKSTEGRRLRHASRRAMHRAAQERAFDADDEGRKKPGTITEQSVA